MTFLAPSIWSLGRRRVEHRRIPSGMGPGNRALLDQLFTTSDIADAYSFDIPYVPNGTVFGTTIPEADAAPASIPAPIVKEKDLGVPRWQHDLWYRIITAALDGHPAQVDLTDITGLDVPAVSRYGATTPALLHWFDRTTRQALARAGPAIRVPARLPGARVSTCVNGSTCRHREASRARRSVGAGCRRTVRARRPDRRATGVRPRDQRAGPRTSAADRIARSSPSTTFTPRRNSTEATSSMRTDVAASRPAAWPDRQHRQRGEPLGGAVLSRSQPRNPDPVWAGETEVSRYRADVTERARRHSVRAIADRAGVAIGTVSTVQRGLGNPSLTTLRAIDRAHVTRSRPRARAELRSTGSTELRPNLEPLQCVNGVMTREAVR